MSELLTAYLFAWLFVAGIALGALANLMLHGLTGGPWGEPLQAPLGAAARLIPAVMLFFLPVLAGFSRIYPWAAGAEHPHWWLNGPFFVARSIAYLIVWSLLALLWFRARRRALASSAAVPALHGWSAAGLIVYFFTVSLASVDWIAALVPQWYSTGFGLVVVTGQMLGAMALGIAAAASSTSAPDEPARQNFQDLGNLLLMYVMTWAYLAFTQYLIIWAANLPREIAWYLPRVQGGWAGLGIFLAVFHFFVPLVILLSRAAKRAPQRLKWLALGVLTAHAADVFWLVAPSVRPQFSVSWADGVALLVLGGLGWAGWQRSLRAAWQRAPA